MSAWAMFSCHPLSQSHTTLPMHLYCISDWGSSRDGLKRTGNEVGCLQYYAILQEDWDVCGFLKSWTRSTKPQILRTSLILRSKWISVVNPGQYFSFLLSLLSFVLLLPPFFSPFLPSSLSPSFPSTSLPFCLSLSLLPFFPSSFVSYCLEPRTFYNLGKDSTAELYLWTKFLKMSILNSRVTSLRTTLTSPPN